MSTPTLQADGRHRARRITVGSLALVTTGVLLLAGCGSSGSSSAAPQGGAQSAPAGQGGARPGGGFGGNFVSGLIADVSGKTLQVQGTSSQTAVTYTSKTTFSEQLKTSLSAIKAGSCVTVVLADAGTTATPTTATPSPATPSTGVTASSVSVSAAVKGVCVGRVGGLGGGRPSGAASGMPSEAPQAGPSGSPQGDRTPGANGFRRPVSGKVTAVSGSTITVASTAFGSTPAQAYTVDTSTTTTYTQEKSTTSAAVKVGTCATAAGKADSTGAVTATTIALRPATNGTCSFGGFGAGNGAGRRTNG